MESKEPLPTIKAYVNAENQATICCPGCGFTRTLDVAKLSSSQKKYRISCRCGNKFGLTFEFRRSYRKKVNFPGKYVSMQDGHGGDCTIEDISITGVGLTCLFAHNVSKGDILEVQFSLDNRKKTHLRKKVEVMVVREQYLGTRFCNQTHPDKALGFYLMP